VYGGEIILFTNCKDVKNRWENYFKVVMNEEFSERDTEEVA